MSGADTAQGAETSAPATSSQPRGGGRGRGQRRGNHQNRRGRGNRGGQMNDAGPATAQGAGQVRQETAQQATPAANPSVPTESQPARDRGRGRGGRGGRGGGGGGGRGRGGRGGAGSGGGQERRGGFVAGTRRTFGGHLTSQTPADHTSEFGAASIDGLNADANEFVPGQQAVSQSKKRPQKQKVKTPKYPLAPKSQAADLPTRLHEDISNGQYECVICSSEVLRTSKIWSCTLCWTVLHLPCVKKWHKSSMEKKDQNQQPEDADAPKTWRCPGCNSALTESPNTHHCWCGKDINPPNVGSLPPHSCGQTCTKPRSTCPHPCYAECHAGPCPPCDLMGPTQSCFCGKHEVQKRCADTDYDNGWSCQEVCGDLLPCGEHQCPKKCHPGLCGSCETLVPSKCYCGKESKDLFCDGRGDIIASHDMETGEVFDGSFECESPCGRKFDCGHHSCEKPCHPQDESEAHCPRSPDVVSHCPCGKTELAQLLEQPRQSCQDEIPHCTESCGKLMPCGHLCDQTCHVGPCPPCFQSMDISCRCGRTTGESLCHGSDVAAPSCMRVCQAQLNCGRHKCGEHCCPGEKRAIERQAAKKKKSRLQAQNSDEVEAEHICIRVCGRTLKCGLHQCQQICHRGPCPSCLEAVFEEISCSCGRTVLQPPQPCGTRPPECRFDCTRPPPCGHPPVKHNCHPDDVDCPKCPFLVEKPCICGKQRLKNQPCWFAEVRCGLPCGEKLKCGVHSCRKTCHRPGECEDASISGSHCEQPCGKPRKSCGHADQDICHAPYPCKEERPCQSKTFITCPCQNRKKEIKCLATLTNPDPEREALKCDDDCLALQRKQQMADAFGIDPATHTDDHIPYSDATLRMVRENMRWAQEQEAELRFFAKDGAEKRIRFKPMRSTQRAFLHSLADDFGFDTESQDPEPHRHVNVFKTPRFVAAPTKTLAQCLKIRNAQAATAARLGTASIHSLREPAAGAASSSSSNDPFNALLLPAPRFALTIDELDTAISKDLAAHNTLSFTTSFLPSEEVIIRATPVTSWGTNAAAVEKSLTALKPAVSRTVTREGLAGSALLVHADAHLNVTRREDTSGNDRGEGGWNAVVGRANTKGRTGPSMASAAIAAAGASSESNRMGRGFVSFSKAPRKKLVEETVDDWETAPDDT